MRERGLGPAHLLDDVLDAARPVTMATHRLRPQAKGASRFAPTPGVERKVGVFQIADEVFFDLQIAFVDRRHKWQLIHVFEDRTVLVMNDLPVGVAVG